MALELVTIEYPSGLEAPDVDAIVAALDGAGLDAELRPHDVRRGGVGLEPWNVVIIASASAFLNALVGEAAKDAWKATAAWIARRVRQRRPPDRPAGRAELIVEIRDRHLSFELTADAFEDPETLQRIVDRLDT
jgi:hypothetical protein